MMAISRGFHSYRLVVLGTSIGQHVLVDVLLRRLYLAFDHNIGQTLVELETLGLQRLLLVCAIKRFAELSLGVDYRSELLV